MVFYFKSTVVDPPAYVYVGKDKFENEELIAHGWEEDVCSLPFSSVLMLSRQFHVDKLSSAHIYLRLRDGETWDNIPEELLTDLGQLTKANSIEGNKKDNITIIYTPWSNLKKDGSMAVGQVSFKDNKKVHLSSPPNIYKPTDSAQVKRLVITQRENAIVNRLNKTKEEKHPDLRQEKEDRLKELRKKDQATQQARKKEEARISKERQEKKWQKDHAYDAIFTEEAMASTSNQDRDENWEDDFM
ncbi:hypothetical protein B0T18DRAFT_393697 [Schizothecium vesticola]|uniref:NFACT RNA-binding domain-containing protein n=1 Tax=Schizothecium vesticola TaxID=314040 RepID=A0AA40EKK2_9PEZI|nr:hypothetical protein B0T18DRAFT_393697 [Schizothecium vesticola]